MNRQERRAFVKKAQSKGISKSTAEAYLAIKDAGLDSLSLPNQVREGDKVKLNIERIKGRKDYEKMNPKYKEFIESNADTVFTAHLEREILVSFRERPEWLFFYADLLHVKETEQNTKSQAIVKE